MPFLLIGGHAVAAYGYGRHTLDVDLLVRETDQEAWHKLLLAARFEIYHLHPNFRMYHPPEEEPFPVDLMLVDESTFQKLYAGSQEQSALGATMRIPSLAHLIALKLHALRSGQPHRWERDFPDIVMLIQRNGVDLAAPVFSEILERYASPSVRAELLRRLAGPEPASG